MPLDPTGATLGALIKSELTAAGFTDVDEETLAIWTAVGKAITTYIFTGLVSTTGTTACPAGAGTSTGTGAMT